jgi:hypothetical protein
LATLVIPLDPVQPLKPMEIRMPCIDHVRRVVPGRGSEDLAQKVDDGAESEEHGH